jgi:hypothetical protein
MANSPLTHDFQTAQELIYTQEILSQEEHVS